VDFLAFAAECGPQVHPDTVAVIVKGESHFNPFSIRDITAKRSYSPASLSEASALAELLYANGHRLALGYMQVTTPWLSTYHLTPTQLLDGCTNIRYGAAILADNYRRYRPGAASDLAGLNMALSAYWSGNPSTGGAYVNYLHGLAATSVRVQETPGVTDGLLAAGALNVKAVYRPSSGYHAPSFSAGGGVFFGSQTPSTTPLKTPFPGGIFFP
jgi:type IV secretion system protein VirB1